MKLFLSKMVMLFCVAAMSSYASGAVTIDGLTYKLFSGTHEARLEENNTWNGELVIPSVVRYEGLDYTVTSISTGAFHLCLGLTKVKIPYTIKEVKAPGGIDPEPYKNPFMGCTNLESIEVDEANEWMCSVDGVLFNKDKTKLYAYPAGKKSDTYSIPEGVSWIGGNAFVECSNLKSIKMPNSVKTIHTGAFAVCRSLEEMFFSENATYINAYTFQGCTSLKHVVIPSMVWGMGEHVFSGCINLEYVIIKAVIDDVRGDTFSFMPQLTCILYVPASERRKYSFYAGSVLPLEAYQPTAINDIPAPQIVNGKSLNGKWFDLSGRRVNSTSIPRGIYIRDGKKVVVK